MAASVWRSFPCSRRQLRLDAVLLCGQSFRWREAGAGEWLGVLADRVWRLKQDETHLYYQVYESSNKDVNSCRIKTEVKFAVKAEETDASHHTSRNQRRATAKKTSEALDECRTKGNHKITFDSGEPVEQKVLLETKYSCSSNLALAKQCKNDTAGIGYFDIKVEKKEDDGMLLVSILEDYFQLGVDIENLYDQWSQADPYFSKTARDFWGIRILRQDPVENLFSFICSSNNNIARITSMVDKLCAHYGQPVAEVEGKMYHTFPFVSSLAQEGVEEKLRELGFGYRAKFISKSARHIIDNHGQDWVSSLRHRSYEEAKAELMTLCGVGAKVADCVCLMSLDKTGAIPVDTHVWQFAARHYLPKLQAAKSVTGKLYQEIGDHFRDLWGPYAGWAHSVLFTSELRHMQSKKSSPDQVEKPPAMAKQKRQSNSTEDGKGKAKYSKPSTSNKQTGRTA